jgi:hypothetical protein
MVRCDLVGCDFEAMGNAAILSEAADGVGGTFHGNSIQGGWHNFDAFYKIAVRTNDYFVNVPNAAYNDVNWGATPWPSGTSGILTYGGIGAWTFRGAGADPDQVVVNGTTNYNVLDRTALTDYSLTLGTDQTSATLPYDGYLKAAALALRPVLVPRTDPGGRFWVSSKGETSMTVTREGTLPAVTFDIQFQ